MTSLPCVAFLQLMLVTYKGRTDSASRRANGELHNAGVLRRLIDPTMLIAVRNAAVYSMLCACGFWWSGV